MLVPATGQFGVPRSKACAQARRYLVLSHTAHFRNALKCVGASGRLPSGNLQIKAVDCRILLRFVVLYYALFSAFGAASPSLPAFLAGRGLGAEELGVVVRQPQCDWFAVPLPGVSPTVSSSFEQNLPSAPSWPQARALLYFTVHGFWAVIAVSFPRRSALSFRDGGAALLQCDPMSEHGEVRPGRKFSTPVNRGDGAVTMLLARSFICRAWRP
jgi:hypothetical protein